MAEIPTARAHHQLQMFGSRNVRGERSRSFARSHIRFNGNLAAISHHRKVSVRSAGRHVIVYGDLTTESGEPSIKMKSHARRRVGAKRVSVVLTPHSYRLVFITEVAEPSQVAIADLFVD